MKPPLSQNKILKESYECCVGCLFIFISLGYYKKPKLFKITPFFIIYFFVFNKKKQILEYAIFTALAPRPIQYNIVAMSVCVSVPGELETSGPRAHFYY